MEEPAIVSVKRKERSDGTAEFDVILKCRKCSRHHHFSFTAKEAGINAKYMAESIAYNYTKRCAPLWCIDCIIERPIVV